MDKNSSNNNIRKNSNDRNLKIINHKLKYIPLGGVDGVNRNCYVVEHDKDIVVIDLGLSFPEDTQYGVDYFIPDVDYLRKRRDNIVGILLTHAHLDHIGAIVHVIKDLGFPPIYGRELTIEFLKTKLREFGLDQKANLNIIKAGDELKLKSITAKFISITHSIPHASSIFIKTDDGNILHTGDFKFDDNPVNEPLPDYEGFKQAAKEGVDLLAIECTNVYSEGKSKSETEIYKILDRTVRNAKGRVIAATFSSLGTRLYSFIEIAQKHNRKIVVTGRSMKTMISLLRKIGYIDAKDSVFINESKVRGMADNKVLILTTGSQGEEFAALSRIARGDHKDIRIKNTDTIIMSSSAIPGNLISVQNLIDDLIKSGARVIHQSFMDVHTSGHGYQKDLKTMVELTNPRNVMPMHGYQSFIHEMSYLLGKWGIKRPNILLPTTGQVFGFDKVAGRWLKERKIPCDDIFVEGKFVAEIGKSLIEERERLASHGVVFIVVPLDKDFMLLSNPFVFVKGFIYVRENKSMLSEMSKIARDLAVDWKSSQRHINEKDVPDLKRDIEKRIWKYITKQTSRKPIVACEVTYSKR